MPRRSNRQRHLHAKSGQPGYSGAKLGKAIFSTFVKKQNPMASTTASQIASVARSAETKFVNAPVNMGAMMRGCTYQFGLAPVRGGTSGLRITGRQIWATLCEGTTSGSSTSKVILPYGQTTTGTSVSGLTFDPDDVQTMPPPLTSLTEVFARYVLRKARVVFTPASSTSNGASLAMAVLTDAATISPTETTTVYDVMQQSNSVCGPIWQMLSVDVPCDDVLRYTYQSGADSTLSPAEDRQDHAFGLIAALSSAQSVAAIYGFFHVEYTIDFYELISQGNELSLRRLEFRAKLLRERILATSRATEALEATERKEERKDAVSSTATSTTLSRESIASVGQRGDPVRTTPSEIVLEDHTPSGLSGGWTSARLRR